jgi:UDP-N-acetylmuramate--alanine ligase
MSGIARLLMARGIAVTGSDLKDSRELLALRQAGAVVSVGHHGDQVGEPDAVVASAAIPPDNPELRHARAGGIPVFTRAQVLAALMEGKRTVAVAGTHGKTTTTSMISVMCGRLGLDPTFVIGGDLNEIGSGAGHGAGELFVAEADESDGSFLLYRPDIAVVTNVEEDHLDYFTGRQDVEDAFASFVHQARSVVACWDDPGARRALSALRSEARLTPGGETVPKPRPQPQPELLTYGWHPDADMVVRVEELRGNGSTAVVRWEGQEIPLTLSVPGRHNLLNAAAALGVAARLGLPLVEAAEALRSFSGVRRRFDCRGVAGGTTFIDDYAHHPSEVAATLDAARIDGWGRVVAVFQPHRYTRTLAMWRQLGESLRTADVVVITDVYGAGEQPIPGITGKLLVEALVEAAPGKRVIYLPRRSEVVPFLAGEVRDRDLVLTIGAGDITMVAEAVLERLRGGGT